MESLYEGGRPAGAARSGAGAARRDPGPRQGDRDPAGARRPGTRGRGRAPAREARRRDRSRRAAGAGSPVTAEQLRALIEAYLDELALTPELGTLAEPMRHALGGKRVRPVLCLATGDAIGVRVENLLPAAAAVELVHSFSLVHDDLPALDDDARAPRRAVGLGAVRRGDGGSRRRRAARRGVQACALLRHERRCARAGRGHARDDRRPVAGRSRRCASATSCTA